MNSAANHPSVQSAKDTVVNGEVSTAIHVRSFGAMADLQRRCPKVRTTNQTLISAGPVGQNVQAEATKTRNEFADLANSRQTPDYKTATGQNLTRRQPSKGFQATKLNRDRLPQLVLPPLELEEPPCHWYCLCRHRYLHLCRSIPQHHPLQLEGSLRDTWCDRNS